MSVIISDLNYTYDKRTVMEKDAVRDVSLEIQNGEFVSIIGEPGCGKSTLLSLIASMEKPRSGSVSVDCGISMMFQSPESQIFEQSVIDDVMYGPLNIGLKNDDARDAAIVALKTVGLKEETWSMSPSKLSGGQKRKVALAGILAMNRPLLLLDEPTSGLDNRSSNEIMAAISKMNESGITVIMATHDCDIAFKYAKRIIVMRNGEIVYDKPSDCIFDDCEKLVSYGIDVPEIYGISKKLYEKRFIKEKNIVSAEKINEMLKK